MKMFLIKVWECNANQEVDKKTLSTYQQEAVSEGAALREIAKIANDSFNKE